MMNACSHARVSDPDFSSDCKRCAIAAAPHPFCVHSPSIVATARRAGLPSSLMAWVQEGHAC
eukprot:1139689-Pelagomonas_calceolata.AAC.2